MIARLEKDKLLTTYGNYIITTFIGNINLLLIIYGSVTSILVNIRSFSFVFLKKFCLNFKQVLQIIFWIIEKPVFRIYFCMLSCYNLHLQHLTLCTTSTPIFWQNEINIIFFQTSWVSQRWIKFFMHLMYHKETWKKLFVLEIFWRLGRKVLNIRELVYRGLNLLIDLKNTIKTQMIILCQSKHWSSYTTVNIVSSLKCH